MIAGLAALIAMMAIKPPDRVFYGGLAAALIVVSPASVALSFWASTLLPGLALCVAYGVLVLRGGYRIALWMLLPFVIVTFMAYTSFPLILLLMLVLTVPSVTWRSWGGIAVYFMLCMVLAVLVTYSLNYLVHGVFGLELDVTRAPVTSFSPEALQVKAGRVVASVENALLAFGYGSWTFVALHVVLLGVSSVVVFQQDRRLFIMLQSVMWGGVAMLVAQTMLSGAWLPFRSFHFFWVAYVIQLVRAAQLLAGRTRIIGLTAHITCIAVLAWYGLITGILYTSAQSWQSETAALADKLPDDTRTLYATGNLIQYPSAALATLQDEEAIAGRMRYLTGRDVVLCQHGLNPCDAVPSSIRNGGPDDQPKVELAILDDIIVIVFPGEPYMSPTSRAWFTHGPGKRDTAGDEPVTNK
ncbi:MAG: hypothetical protein HRU31_01570 [Rhodobacteraceae bacterium]|nr:hypothetical protein [Paracoccaceae bacterium]